MKKINIIQLLLLSAIWGSSFIFMRVIVPILGPILTASMRTLIAGVFLVTVYLMTGYKIHWRRDFKDFIIIGILNSAIPFSLFAYAALYMPASLSSVLNATTPMVGAILATLFAIELLTPRKIIGLILGTCGVALVSSLSISGEGISFYLSILACLIAASCYSINAIYVKLKASHIEAKAIAAGSQLFSGLLLLPFSLFKPVYFTLNFKITIIVILFSIICSAIAYLLYFSLMHNVGPTKTLTVTFLVPIFGTAWAAIVLRESISFSTIIGGSIILLGVYFITSVGSNSRK